MRPQKVPTGLLILVSLSSYLFCLLHIILWCQQHTNLQCIKTVCWLTDFIHGCIAHCKRHTKHVVCVVCFRFLVSKVYLRCLYLFASACVKCSIEHDHPQSVCTQVYNWVYFLMQTLCASMHHWMVRSFIKDSVRWKYCLHAKINSIVLSSKDLLSKALINGNNERERKEINWHVCESAIDAQYVAKMR